MAARWSAARWIERVRAIGVERAITLAVLAVAAVALAAPLATVRWLPFVDYPQHLGTIAAIHGQGDPTFDRYFVVEYARSQYLLLYWLGDWLAYPFGVEGAGRATAILSIATLPLAVALLLHVHRRPALGGALAAPIALHAYVFWGFLNYAAGMVLALVAVAMAARVARRPDARTALALALAALATFYAHAQLYAWMGIACVVQLAVMAPSLGRARALRAAGWSIGAALPSVFGVIAWLRMSDVIEHGEAGSRSGHAAEVAAAGGAPSFMPAADTARAWLSHSFDVYRDGTGIDVAIAFFAAALVWVALRGLAAAPRDEVTATVVGAERPARWPWLARLLARAPDPGMPQTLAPEAILVATFALYLFAPFSYRLIEPINHRFLPLALALLPVLGPRGPLRMPARIAASALAIALAVGTAQAHAARFGETDREMGDLALALRETQPGQRLLGLIYDPQSEVVPLAVYMHAHQYYQARVGGLACFSFVEFPKSPVQYAEGAAPPPFPPRFEWTPQRYDHAVWGDSFDYWLVRHAIGRRPGSIFRARAPSGAPAPVPVYEGDRWTLYAVPR